MSMMTGQFRLLLSRLGGAPVHLHPAYIDKVDEVELPRQSSHTTHHPTTPNNTTHHMNFTSLFLSSPLPPNYPSLQLSSPPTPLSPSTLS